MSLMLQNDLKLFILNDFAAINESEPRYSPRRIGM